MSRGSATTPEELAAALGLHRPTAEQAAVIAHPLRPLLVVAGAGSGKTATMSQRVVHLVARGEVRPGQVLGLTFTRKATAELDQRVASRLNRLMDTGMVEPDEDGAEPTIATYNSFAASLVREHGLRIGVDPESTLITEARAWQIASELVESRLRPLPIDTKSTAISTILTLDAALSNNLISIDRAAADLGELHSLFEGLASVRGLRTQLKGILETAAKRMGMLEAVGEYREYKRRHGLLSFGDQVALACRIAEEVPEVAAALRTQYSAILLDEFQDTSVAQLRFLSALFAGGGVTAVGDPNQAIYGWRGASAGALDTFHARFNPDGVAARDAGAPAQDATPVLDLSTAWRNDLAILDAANAISAPLRHHVPKPGDATIVHCPVKALSPRPAEAGLGQGRVNAAYLPDPLAEAATVAEFMAEHMRPDAQLAVLTRVRSAMPLIAEALQERNIPYEIVGLGGMLTIPEVADLRSVLAVAANPERGDRLMRLLTGAGMGAADLRALTEQARRLVRQPRRAGDGEEDAPDAPLIAEAIDALVRRAGTRATGEGAPGDPGDPGDPGEPGSGDGADRAVTQGAPAELSAAGARAARRIARAVRRVRRSLTLPLPEIVDVAEQALDLDIEVTARVGNPLGRRALEAFRACVEQYTADVPAPDLAGFLDWLELARDKENGLEAPEVEPEPGAVQLLTIHAAKGLEWDAVAVVGMSESTFPNYRGTAGADLQIKDAGWMTRMDEFPHPLRADAETLPPFELGVLEPGAVDAQDVKELFTQYKLALGRHQLAEERRLAYVAITRARRAVLLTGSHFTGTSQNPKPMSRFLDQLRRRNLVTPYGEGFTTLDPAATNPMVTRMRTATWPEPEAQDPVARARRDAADAVRHHGADPTTPPQDAGAHSDPVIARWRAEARLLLAERAQRRSEAPSVRLPDHLAATRVDDLRADPQRFALDLRRPLPPRPQAAGRLGTVFHEAIAARLGRQRQLLTLPEAGVPETLGPADRTRLEGWLDTAEHLPLLAGHVLEDTEIDLELTLARTTLRCRLDAVFRNPEDSTWLIVDWKTGRRRVPVDQLSIYVHAWAAARRTSTHAVRAAYVYVDYPGGLVEELSSDSLLGVEQIADLLEIKAP